MAPKVSVLIPTYNYARYLPEAIESVLSQSFTDFELLIIDDHSTDDTAEIATRYAQKDKRVCFRVNRRNIGMVENWNLCLKEAEGEYVKYLFADDLLCSVDAVRLMVEALDEDPQVSLVASARQIIDSEGRPIEILTHFPDSGRIDGRRVINRCLRCQKNLVGEPTAVMFRKRLCPEGFNPKFRQIVDMEFWFRLLEAGGFAYINRPLAAFRRHDVQQTRLNRGNAPLILEDTERLLRDYVLNEDKRYIGLSRFRKSYLVYDYNYQTWKLHRQGMLQRSEAKGRIASGYGWSRFVLGYPLYKLYKPFNKFSFRLENFFAFRPGIKG
ncbi:MAG: glycosyltransferase [Deltaproteobacteria bacterium]|nr:glycosyltransferase [Deltaproteobacteria bacterium]